MNHFCATPEQRSILIVDGDNRRLVLFGSDEFDAIDPATVRAMGDDLLTQIGGGSDVPDIPDDSRSLDLSSLPVDEAKRHGLVAVIDETDSVRKLFITPITGQDLTYKEKEIQAAAYVALSQEPDPQSPEARDQFGFVLGEVGLTAETPYQVAQVILAEAAVMRAVGPVIERGRLEANDAIGAAQDGAGVAQALSVFRAKLAELQEDFAVWA